MNRLEEIKKQRMQLVNKITDDNIMEVGIALHNLDGEREHILLKNINQLTEENKELNELTDRLILQVKSLIKYNKHKEIKMNWFNRKKEISNLEYWSIHVIILIMNIIIYSK